MSVQQHRIQLVSDLHIERDKNGDQIKLNEYLTPAAPILLIAGDLGSPFLPSYQSFLQQASQLFETVILTSGNHEYYSFNGLMQWSMTEVEMKIQQIVTHLSNVYYLQNEAFELDEKTVILGTTLWTYIPPRSAYAVTKGMNDYNCIYTEDSSADQRLINTDDINKLYAENVGWLTEMIATKYADKRIIVLSHHLPSFQLIADQYKGQPTNCAFASNLESLLHANTHVLYFLSGHTHTSFDTMIEHTRCIVNPKGYMNHQTKTSENPNYQSSFVIEI